MSNWTSLIPARVRSALYVGFGVLSLAQSSILAYSAAVQSPAPVWAVGGGAVLGVIGAAFGFVAAGNTEVVGSTSAEQTTYNIQVPEGMDFKTVAEKLRSEKYFPRSIMDAPDPSRFISFDTDQDLTGEVGIYANGEKIGVAPIVNQRVLYKLPELPAGENKVSAVHPDRGVLYTFTFDSEPGKHVAG